MAGTFVHDAIATELLAGTGTDIDLAADATTIQTAGAVQVNAPGMVQFRLTAADPGTGTAATLRVGVQGCETENFSTSDVVDIGWFGLLTEDGIETEAALTGGDAEFVLGPIYVGTKYIRAAAYVDDGTAGDFAGSTLYMEAPSYKLGVHFNDSIGNPSQPTAGLRS
jgi:hypothetical protein